MRPCARSVVPRDHRGAGEETEAVGEAERGVAAQGQRPAGDVGPRPDGRPVDRTRPHLQQDSAGRDARPAQRRQAREQDPHR